MMKKIIASLVICVVILAGAFAGDLTVKTTRTDGTVVGFSSTQVNGGAIVPTVIEGGSSVAASSVSSWGNLFLYYISNRKASDTFTIDFIADPFKKTDDESEAFGYTFSIGSNNLTVTDTTSAEATFTVTPSNSGRVYGSYAFYNLAMDSSSAPSGNYTAKLTVKIESN